MTAITPASVRATAANRRRPAVARAALSKWSRQGAAMVGAARHRYRSPALTIAGLACFVAAFFQLGLFAGLLSGTVACFAYEWLGRPEPEQPRGVRR